MVTGDSVHIDGPGTSSETQAEAVVRSSPGILVLHGEESKDFLQRISTSNFSTLAHGAAVQTVLTDEKGRIVDVVTAVHQGGSILLMTSDGRSALVKAWLERFIIMEDITVDDESGTRSCAIVFAPADRSTAIGAPDGAHQSIPLSYHSLPAALILMPSSDEISAFLSAHSIPIMSSEAYDDLRIRFGIPAMGREITDKSNPLEVGLKGLVDFAKGCYIGQEVIARLSTYEKVQRRLCRVRLSIVPAENEKPHEIIEEDTVHGYITTLGHKRSADGTVDALTVLKSAAATVGAKFSLSGTDTGVTVDTVF